MPIYFQGQDRNSGFNDVFSRIRTEYGELRRETCNFIKKETPPEVLFCEFWKISKNSFF